MKQITYTPHLILRLKLREIPYSLPKMIYEKSEEHYFDNATKRMVATKAVMFKERLRDMAIIYENRNEEINIITIHLLKANQKIGRVYSGRWKKYEKR